ncbi:MAG: hypothetical protein U1E87_05470 [Alphaproteobacteria bacterium]
MIVARVASLVFVSIALMALGADILAWLETDTFDPHSVLALLAAVSQGAARGLSAWAGTLPQPVSGAVNGLLQAWAFLALGIPGVLLALLGLRK